MLDKKSANTHCLASLVEYANPRFKRGAEFLGHGARLAAAFLPVLPSIYDRPLHNQERQVAVSLSPPLILLHQAKQENSTGQNRKKTLLDQTGEKIYTTTEEKNALCKTGKKTALDQTGEGMNTTKQERIAKEKTGKHCDRPNRTNCTKQNRQKGGT